MTAGIFLKVNDRYAFMLGPNKENNAHGVVRLGGHALDNETAVECALREVQEEVAVTANLYDSPQTYCIEKEGEKPELVEPMKSYSVTPLLVLGNHLTVTKSIMFVGNTTQVLQPSGEAQGIILLNETEIRNICEEDITLDDFLKTNGKILERTALNREFKLIPYLQLRFLNWVLQNTNI